MNDQAKETTVERKRVFGRVYDHDNATVTITAAFDPNYKKVVELRKLPASVIEGFALQGIGDYVVNEANEALKDEDNGTEEERRKASLGALDEAETEAVEGKIDFRSGVGLGGMRSAIGVLGAVLFEMGKTFVKNARGEKLEFNDLHTARAAVKSLYLDTTPKGPFTPVVDEKGQPVLDKDGKQKQKPTNADSTLTGRMIFNAIQAVPEVAAAIAAKRKAKKSIVETSSVLG